MTTGTYSIGGTTYAIDEELEVRFFQPWWLGPRGWMDSDVRC